MSIDRNRIGAAAELLLIDDSSKDRKLFRQTAELLLSDLGRFATGELPSDVGNPGDSWCSGMYSLLALWSRQSREVLPADPSLAVRLAVLDLQDAVQGTYHFKLRNLAGQVHESSELPGKFAVIYIFESWSPVCRRGLPEIEKLFRKEGDKLAILGIASESGETVSSFFERNGYTFPVLIDNARDVYAHYGVFVIPTTLILAPSGSVVKTFISSVTEPGLRAVLRRAGLK
jgi:peroxiredoxin